MWVYSQTTGKLWDDIGDLVYSKGYSGYKEGKNNASMENIKDMGPIPRGFWEIGEVYDSRRVGDYAIVLIPCMKLERKDFRIHGDSLKNPGFASKGCLILPLSFRKKIINSKDKILKVVI